MLPSLTFDFGNAASRSHAYGWRAEALVKEARETLAAALGGEAREIVFTSGATESDDLAVLGAARAYQDKGNHIVTSRVEHRAVLDAAGALSREGFEVTYLDPDPTGRVEAAAVAASLRAETTLVSVMAANNEIGTLNPVAEIGRLCKERGVLFHTDAVQAFGKIPLDVQEIAADLVSISAHKICGPKGVGALWVRARAPRVRLVPQMFGGGHERGFRSGTLNVAGIVGFAAAAKIALASREEEGRRVAELRDRLQEAIVSAVPDVRLNGHPSSRLPGTLNLAFGGVDGDGLFLELSGLAVSPGAACSSASLDPSHVLLALGLPVPLARASIRFSLGRFTTRAEIEEAATMVIRAVSKLRQQERA